MSHPAVGRQRLPHHIHHEHRDGNPAAFRLSVLLNSGLSALQLGIDHSTLQLEPCSDWLCAALGPKSSFAGGF